MLERPYSAQMSTELVQTLHEIDQADLSSLSLPQTMGVLERLLALGAPLVHRSIQPAGSPEAVRQLVAYAGGSTVPDELLTWFSRHDGQVADAHRALTPKNDYRAWLSVAQSRAHIDIARAEGLHQPGWVPLLSRPGEEDNALGLHTQGPKAGSIWTLHQRVPGHDHLEALVVALIHKFRDVVHLPPPENYWVHGVSAILAEANRYHHALPGGLWTRASANCPVQIFRDYWAIHHPDELRATIRNLETCPPDSSTFAWDHGRAASLASLGRVAGWLGAEEAWAIQYRVAKGAQERYDSWHSFAQSYCEELRDKDRSFLKRLFDDPTSPFQLPWRSELSETPTPDTPTERVRLTPEDHDRFNALLSRWRTPRLLEVDLEPGYYTLDDYLLAQPCVLRGADADQTVIQGLTPGAPAFATSGGGFELEQLTVEHDMRDAGDASDGVEVYWAAFTARGCHFRGSGSGAMVAEGSYAHFDFCTFVGETERGLSIEATVNLNGGSIQGNRFGVIVIEEARLRAANFVVQATHNACRVESGTATLSNAQISSEEGDAVFLMGSAKLKASGCTLRAREGRGLAVGKPREGADPCTVRATLDRCVIEPSNWGFTVPAGRLQLEGCRVTSRSGVGGGRVVARKTRIESSVYASKGGYLGLLGCEVESGDRLSLRARGGLIRAVETPISTGVETLEGGCVRLSGCKVAGDDDSAAVNVESGHVALLGCHIDHDAQTRAIDLQTGTLTAVATRFDTTAPVLAQVATGATGYWWRCRFESTHQQPVLLALTGEIHLHSSELYSNGWGVFAQPPGVAHADDCGADCAANPLIAAEGATVVEDAEASCEALRRRDSNTIEIVPSLLGEELIELLDELGGIDEVLPRLVAQTIGLALPDSDVTVTKEDGSLGFVTSAPMPDSFVSYLARVLSSAPLARAVSWTIEVDLEVDVFDEQTFSFGQLHQALRESSDSE